jgi:DNA polymerase-3 subunit gamma/tau
MNQACQPLHHKYRPQRLSELVGQEAIASTLGNALRSGTIALAYLFSGPRGTGKTSSARILARSLNGLASDGPTPEPCGHCGLCTSITASNALDVIEIDAASNTGVDNIRELIERSRFAPVQARCQRFDFRRIPLEALDKPLTWIAEQEEIAITPQARHLVAQRAQGGPPRRGKPARPN